MIYPTEDNYNDDKLSSTNIFYIVAIGIIISINVLFIPILGTKLEILEEKISSLENELNSTPDITVIVEDAPVVEETIYIYDLSDNDICYLAKTVYGEARGVKSTMEQAAVIWCVLNRVDAGYGTIKEVVTAPYQFTGYSKSHPVTEEFYDLAKDVLIRWYSEKDGKEDVGRVLPSNYLYFSGDGKRNSFRSEFKTTSKWDWSLDNPYET